MSFITARATRNPFQKERKGKVSLSLSLPCKKENSKRLTREISLQVRTTAIRHWLSLSRWKDFYLALFPVPLEKKKKVAWLRRFRARDMPTSCRFIVFLAKVARELEYGSSEARLRKVLCGHRFKPVAGCNYKIWTVQNWDVIWSCPSGRVGSKVGWTHSISTGQWSNAVGCKRQSVGPTVRANLWMRSFGLERSLNPIHGQKFMHV